MKASNAKTRVESAIGDAWMELSALYVLTWIAFVEFLGVHWFIALSITPFAMLAMLTGVSIAVQLLWLTVISIDKLGAMLGIRKSPLS